MIRNKTFDENLTNKNTKPRITWFLLDNLLNHLEDTNKAINDWFDFILTMADEQLYFSKDRLTHLIESSQRNDTPEQEVLRRVKQMKMSKLK